MKQQEGKVGRPTTAVAPWPELYKSVGSQQKLAEKLGVSKATVGKWAAGVHRIPTLAKKELMRLCSYYGIQDVLGTLKS